MGQDSAGRPRMPSMADVAGLAGVSHQTVSRVLNGHPNVRGQTRDRVLAAIAELGYRPNTAARTLVTRRSGVIGVVTAEATVFGPASTFVAVEQAARTAGYFVSVASVRQPYAEALAGALEHFMDQRVDGVVLIAPQQGIAEVARAVSARVPVVMVAAGIPHPSDQHAIGVDQFGGAVLATEHLLSLGHRTVVHVAGPPEWFDAQRRVEGWRYALELAGARVGEPLVGDWTAARAYQLGRRMVDDGLPTAVFAANDQTALGLLRAFAEAGVLVPRDVSLVGFDDSEGSDCFVPPLTTVRQDFAALGRRCIALLTAAMAGGDADHTPIAPQLVVRASTAPPER